MTRHFLGLYLLIIATLAGSSWCQDRILAAYSRADPPSVGMEVLRTGDIAGTDMLKKLADGDTVAMQGSSSQSWILKQIDHDHVVALRNIDPEASRRLIDWVLTLAFYAAIALVLMAWLWPLTRDLGLLERAVARFGDRNWRFEAPIRARSQVYPLSETFRKMAARIDGLIASHKDMSNAVSHDIKTPLSRMQFDLELAREARSPDELRRSLENIEVEVNSLNALITAALSYAILERAEMSLHIGSHDFVTLIPAIVESTTRGIRPEVVVDTHIQQNATKVFCDAHLMQTVIKNLLSNAMRYARSRVQVTFVIDGGRNQLFVDDDGPGIPASDRERVLTSFVQLDQPAQTKTGFGLGLAIVTRAIEWHDGQVAVVESPLGGTRISVSWPIPFSLG